MIKCGDECASRRDGYFPDGQYFPRIFIVDPDPLKLVQTALTNFGGRPEYKFFYSTAEEVVETMRRALERQHLEL